MGMLKASMTEAEAWLMSECYPVDSDWVYVRRDPPPELAERVWSSNDDAGHMGYSFSPTCHYVFKGDGSKLEVGYSFAEVME